MTPAEKILEALGERALTGRALYQALSGENAAAVDVALSQLLKRGLVTLELGHYQKARRQGSPQPAAPAPAASVQRPAAAVKVSAPSKPALNTREPVAGPVAAHKASTLSPREQAVYELAQRGYRRAEIMERLGISANAVSTHVSNARHKLGARGAISALARESKPAPAAAVPLAATPSREGAEAATAGAIPASIGIEKREEKPPRRFSADLRARLIEVQRRKAEELQAACAQVSALRQELADVEEMVRIVSEEGTHG